jgi:hypothetical protein
MGSIGLPFIIGLLVIAVSALEWRGLRLAGAPVFLRVLLVFGTILIGVMAWNVTSTLAPSPAGDPTAASSLLR